jgi:lysine-specific histone demethylase 1B
VSGNEEAETKAHAALHYSEQPWIEVVEKTGESVRAKRVIVAVPVSVLQDEDITFQPPLPTDKLDAARRINMEPCVKLFLRFSQPFWPEELQGVICAECTVPEFWVNEKQPAKGPKEYVLVGFLCADNARRLSAMTRIEARDACLAQLDEMFGATEHNLRHNAAACVRAGGVANPATRAFIDMVIQDWTESPHIRGGYSSPSPFAAAPGADRRALARPVEKQLFFCGEATQEVFATMHAALDSGRRAAKEVLDSLRAARDAPPSLKKRASPRSKLAPVTAPRPRM